MWARCTLGANDCVLIFFAAKLRRHAETSRYATIKPNKYNIAAGINVSFLPQLPRKERELPVNSARLQFLIDIIIFSKCGVNQN